MHANKNTTQALLEMQVNEIKNNTVGQLKMKREEKEKGVFFIYSLAFFER
jgi:hypothetical protein